MWPFLVTTQTQSIHNDFVALKGEKKYIIFCKHCHFKSHVLFDTLPQHQRDKEEKREVLAENDYFSLCSSELIVSDVTTFSYSTDTIHAH